MIDNMAEKRKMWTLWLTVSKIKEKRIDSMIYNKSHKIEEDWPYDWHKSGKIEEDWLYDWLKSDKGEKDWLYNCQISLNKGKMFDLTVNNTSDKREKGLTLWLTIILTKGKMSDPMIDIWSDKVKKYWLNDLQ